jgi:hypothetical protein
MIERDEKNLRFRVWRRTASMMNNPWYVWGLLVFISMFLVSAVWMKMNGYTIG